MTAAPPRRAGVAPIKAAYLIRNTVASGADDDAAERDTNPASAHGNGEEGGERAVKKPKLSGSQRKKLKKAEAAAERKKSRGMNTARKFERIHDANMVCNNISRGRPCPRDE